MSTHGLRASMISLLIASGAIDAAVVLHTGHANMNSLKSYHNLMNANRRKQMDLIFKSKETRNIGNAPSSAPPYECNGAPESKSAFAVP